ncbi:hypothetical protein EMCRGX_G028214 [Ephydatia muelleri]
MAGSAASAAKARKHTSDEKYDRLGWVSIPLEKWRLRLNVCTKCPKQQPSHHKQARHHHKQEAHKNKDKEKASSGRKAPQAAKAPQAGKAAFASLTKSLLCEWEFIQRVVPDSGYALILLDEAIMKCFFLTLLSGNITEAECIAVNNLQSKK